jgi:hypothetical protein
LRDLKFVFLGSIPLAFLIYAHRWDCIFKRSLKLAVVTLIFAAYFLGLGIFHVGMLMETLPHSIEYPGLGIRIFEPQRQTPFEQLEARAHIRMNEIRQAIPDGSLRQLERTLFIKEVSGTLYMASVILFVFFVYYWVCNVSKFRARVQNLVSMKAFAAFVLPVFGVLLIGIAAFVTNRSKASIQERMVEYFYDIALAENIKKAVEALWSVDEKSGKQLGRRLTGILSLDAIAGKSTAHSRIILELLTDYLRRESKWDVAEKQSKTKNKRALVAADVQLAVRVIARRSLLLNGVPNRLYFIILTFVELNLTTWI